MKNVGAVDPFGTESVHLTTVQRAVSVHSQSLTASVKVSRQCALVAATSRCVPGGHGGGGGNGGSGGSGSTSLLAVDSKDEKRKLPPVNITLVSFAVSRKAYTRVRTCFCTGCTFT